MTRALTIAAIVLALASAASFIVGMQLTAAAPREVPPKVQRDIDCMDIDPETREHVRAIMLEAIDMALKDHIAHTFEVWMRDERDQPARAANGVRQGIKAYTHARASAMKWNPPC